MSLPLKIAFAQINPMVGDLEGNCRRIRDYARRAAAAGADLVLFPELAVSGYPPEDLLFREGFVERAEACVRELAAAVAIPSVVGHPRREQDRLFNAASWLIDGEVSAVYDKQILPNYGVFDEVRYFSAGRRPAAVVEAGGVRAALTICEDIWQPGPARAAADAGAELILNINASPYHLGKRAERLATLRARCRETGLPVAYVNLVGGQDELVFDGRSMMVDGNGTPRGQAAAFEEALLVFDGRRLDAAQIGDEPDEDGEVYRALVLGVHDYVTKNGFDGAVIGLSGGVDSALTLAIAADALGPGRVEAVMMPSRYTSAMSLEDAAACARNLGVRYHELSIEPAFQAMLASLTPVLAGGDGRWEPDVTQENLQARCRGMMLMALSNRHGRLVLATGNKSELSVGYATLYGDMAGGFAPLKDISKPRVYRLCRYRNRQGEVIPDNILRRPPSAELAADQKDEDSLPPYEVLDAILERYLEHEKAVGSIVAEGFDETTVREVVRKVNRNEYKRRQAAPGVKVTRRAFGRERRYPITCRYD